MLGFGCGLTVAAVGTLVWYRDLRPVLRLAGAGAAAVAVLSTAALVLAKNMSGLEKHFAWVFYGRSEQSAESRFQVWERGAERLFSEAPVFGVGPDMSKQLFGREMHNDLLSFAVERAMPGTAGLLLFVAMAAVQSIRLARLRAAHGDRMAIAFPATLAALAVHAQFHEVFHQRPVWLLLALQQAFYVRACAATGAIQRRARASTSRTMAIT